MRKAINTGLCDENTLERLKSTGFDGCDIGLTVGLMNDNNWEEKMHKERELLDKFNLECVQVHLPFYDIFLSSEIILDDVKNAIFNSMKAMQILGCKWGAYHPRTAFNHKCDSVASMKDNYYEISMYLEEAEKCGVGIAIENIPVFPDCPQHRFFTSDYDEFNFFVESFQSDKVGICWDFGHANLMPIKQEKAFGILGDKIKITHIHNNFKFCDAHIMPSLGTIDWENVMPAFKKCGYNGDFSLEIKYFNMNDEVKSYYLFGYDCLCVLEKYFNKEN